MAGQRARAAHGHRACRGAVPGRPGHRARFAGLAARSRRQGAGREGPEAAAGARGLDGPGSRAGVNHPRPESHRRPPDARRQKARHEPAHISPQAAPAPSGGDLTMPFLHDILHKLEVGTGTRYLRVGLIVLVVIVLAAVYNFRGYRNMSTQEAMDMAQLGRNIAQGKGYTTLFIRPFSIYLVKTRNLEKGGAPQVGKTADLAEVRGMHPDLANPPVYPVVLAALMKILPFNYTASSTKPFWRNNSKFWRFQPDFLIAVF